MRSIQLLYEELFNAMMSGFAHCQAVYDKDGVMVDFIFIMTNKAFLEQSGIQGGDVTGKSVSVVVTGLRETSPELFIRYARVAKTGKSERFEIYLAPLLRTFDVSVYSVEPNTFTIIFDDISEQKTQAKKLLLANESTILAFVSSLEYRDLNTQEHTVRVTELSVKLGKRLGMDEYELETVRRGSLLHDIGKIGISDTILNKPGPLTKTEMEVMQKHPQLGYD